MNEFIKAYAVTCAESAEIIFAENALEAKTWSYPYSYGAHVSGSIAVYRLPRLDVYQDKTRPELVKAAIEKYDWKFTAGGVIYDRRKLKLNSKIKIPEIGTFIPAAKRGKVLCN